MPDRSRLRGKRDYVILALLVGCALRRRELASLNIAELQLHENRWEIVDLRGKGGCSFDLFVSLFFSALWRSRALALANQQEDCGSMLAVWVILCHIRGADRFTIPPPLDRFECRLRQITLEDYAKQT